MSARLTDDERARLRDLHDALARDVLPRGAELDGYYIFLADASCTLPPQSQMGRRATDESWALHREHIRAGRHIVLHGPEPTEIYPPASWSEIESALYSELEHVGERLRECPGYCILNLCRLIYSFETGDVVISKAQASDWARDAQPECRRHIELARKSYARQATAADWELMLTDVGAFLEFARTRIECAQQRGRRQRAATEAGRPHR